MSDIAEQSAAPSSRRRGQIIGPITSTGAAIAVLGVVAYAAGWQLGWIELLVLAAACFLALALAIPFIVGRSRLVIERRFEPDRIAAGESIAVELSATNTGRTASRRVDVDERIGRDVRSIGVPSLASGATHVSGYRLGSTTRARLQLGPAELTRADPLGLLRRSVAQSGTDVCWIYPATTILAPLPVGFAKDLEGPTSDASPAGDVAFHAIRPYVTGDDRRHIHWLSTARTGELMVRHYVDNRRPHLAVLLDVGSDAYSIDSFEEAVSVAASLAASMLRQRLPVSVRIGGTTVLGSHRAGDRDTVLEAFTECTPETFSADDLVVSVAEFIRSEPHASALAIVTGHRSADELLGAVVHARRHAKTIVATIGDQDATAHALPGARVVTATDLDRFRAGWGALVS